MVANIKKIVKLYALHAKMDLAWLLRDLGFALLAICSDFISCVASVASVFLLAVSFDGIGGMKSMEVLFMLGFFTLVTGTVQLLMCNCNMGNISRVIGRGQLEHMLIQPVSLPLQIMTTGFIPFTGSSGFISGIVMLIISINSLDINLSLWWILALIGSMAISFAIYLGLMYLFSVFAFYSPVGAEEISTSVQNVLSIGMYPLSGMPLMIQVPLITIVPTGLLGWFPALALLDKSPIGLDLWYPLIFAGILWTITGLLFRKGLKHYVKKGINRYSQMGHRS